MRAHRVVVLLGLFAPVTMLGAQAACYASAGMAFGVTGYHCASCSVQGDPGARRVYSFQAEPVVLSVTNTSAFRQGDVIESVDGHPITTREGSDAFAFPILGQHAIVVRRNGNHVAVPADASSCDSDHQVWQRAPGSRVASVGDSAATRDYAFTIGMAVRDGIVLPTPSESQSRFGFAVACSFPCTKLRPPDGLAYWKYGSNPTIAAVRPDSPAERAGLLAGDVILRIDGLSVLEQAGAARLYNSESATSLKITVTRSGREFDVVIQSW